jgi:GNAT superfamily N-acetyltransferase
MSPAELVRRVEALAHRAWSPAEERQLGGWVLRYADGFSRRLNSATAAGPAASPLDELLTRSQDWLAARDVGLIVRLHDEGDDVDEALARRGYAMEAPVWVMTAELGASPQSSAGEVELTSRPGSDWIGFQRHRLGDRAQFVAGWQAIIDRVPDPAAFALLRHGGGVVAAGLAVLEADWLGLFQVKVDSSWRRRGLGRALSAALLQWGREAGAGRGYLQVEQDNVAANRLYGSFGFSPAYSYWYRRAP